MKELKTLLKENHSSKTKAELVELLSGIKAVVTPSVYSSISGVDPNELMELTKKEILEVVSDFDENYDSNWESNLSTASTDVLKLIFKQLETDDNSFATLDAGDSDFPAELGNIDFSSLIGAPLIACVNAQSQASLATVSFIKEVGFTPVAEGSTDIPEVIYVDFTHNKQVPDPENEGETIEEKVELKVPFIALLNVPSLRIETCEIDFNVKLNSAYNTNVSSTLGLNLSTSGGGFLGIIPKFKVSSSYRRTSSTGVKVEKQYTMNVKVQATNDEMPAGLERVLGILAG